MRHDASPAGDPPAVHGLMLAAVRLGSLGIARQLLLIDPIAALTDRPGHEGVVWTHESPLHMAALRGQGPLFLLLLAAAPPAAVRATCGHWSAGDAWSLVHRAALGGSVEGLQALLGLAPQSASQAAGNGDTPLNAACAGESLEAARLLLGAAPQTAAAEAAGRWLPLHRAALHGSAGVIQLLLAAGAPGADRATAGGVTPLHLAAAQAHVEAVEALLAACPAAARAENRRRRRPLHHALRPPRQHLFGDGQPEPEVRVRTARLLLSASGMSADALLDALAAAGPDFQPLHADLAAHLPLTAQQWQRAPSPCAALAHAAPAVLARSDAEASQLVRRLPAAAQRRLRLAMRCLARAQRGSHVQLPPHVVRAVLAQSLPD